MSFPQKTDFYWLVFSRVKYACINVHIFLNHLSCTQWLFHFFLNQILTFFIQCHQVLFIFKSLCVQNLSNISHKILIQLCCYFIFLILFCLRWVDAFDVIKILNDKIFNFFFKFGSHHFLVFFGFFIVI